MVDNLTEETIAEYKEALEMFDNQPKHRVNINDVGAIFRGLGIAMTDKDAKAFSSQLDAGDGFINFPALMKMLKEKLSQQGGENELREAFKTFDADNSGSITLSELKKEMKRLGTDLTDAELDEMMKSADTNGDGVVDYNEFVSMLMK